MLTYNIYPNLGNLRSDYPKEAKELVKSVADVDWKTNRIYYFRHISSSSYIH